MQKRMIISDWNFYKVVRAAFMGDGSPREETNHFPWYMTAAQPKALQS